jgi:hypothetical protein
LNNRDHGFENMAYKRVFIVKRDKVTDELVKCMSWALCQILMRSKMGKKRKKLDK